VVPDVKVAIYWDFENVHASVLDDERGEGTYRGSSYRPQDPVIDIDPVVDYAAGLGGIVINRAYGNWQWFGRYRFGLQAHAVDLVQLFPLGHGVKNGADIRLAIDVIEDLHQQPHITHVVVVAGDSDYVPLAQKCRKLGKSVIGIGAGSTSERWKAACDEFRSYHALLSSATEFPLDAVTTTTSEPRDIEEARDLLVRAVRSLAAGRGEPWVVKAAVRPTVVRLDPSFDEAAYGFSSFNRLVAHLSPYVRERKGEHDHEMAVTVDLPASERGDTPLDAVAVPPRPPTTGEAAVLMSQLKKKHLYLPDDLAVIWCAGRVTADAWPGPTPPCQASTTSSTTPSTGSEPDLLPQPAKATPIDCEECCSGHASSTCSATRTGSAS
jgi:NYN domain